MKNKSYETEKNVLGENFLTGQSKSNLLLKIFNYNTLFTLVSIDSFQKIKPIMNQNNKLFE